MGIVARCRFSFEAFGSENAAFPVGGLERAARFVGRRRQVMTPVDYMLASDWSVTVVCTRNEYVGETTDGGLSRALSCPPPL